MDTTNYFHGLSSGFSTVQSPFNFVFRALFSTNVCHESCINKLCFDLFLVSSFDHTGDSSDPPANYVKTPRLWRREFQVLVMHKLRIKLHCLYIRGTSTIAILRNFRNKMTPEPKQPKLTPREHAKIQVYKTHNLSARYKYGLYFFHRSCSYKFHMDRVTNVRPHIYFVVRFAVTSTKAIDKLIFNIFTISLVTSKICVQSLSLVLASHRKRIALKNKSELRAATRRRRRGSRSSEETDRALDPGIPSRPTWAT
ncbi:hypothetical protein ALC62_03487 [Cyphomyrmex costatus]|uniref:Uncharacterized protein n=1 Tax=Cyphomyrmex costatus TaxID=456900 RepID=A0A151ILF9_9HYME|nr:hypothetical protein ALC62_03487 [Cyphomyrmex costatus]